MNEQRNNGRGIFYGVIGVATLVVAIVGATFAYFTATATGGSEITGNMATVQLGLSVRQLSDVDDVRGMIPMSNGMVERAINNSNNEVCVDDNGNAVCQIYEIIVTNQSSAAQFVDGYVALKGGSGTAKDLTTSPTTMRWAQVFKGDGKTVEGGSVNNGAATTDYSTAGVTSLGAQTENTFSQIGEDTSVNNSGGFNTANIKTVLGDVSDKNTIINGSPYETITSNYIRTSVHTWKEDSTPETYSRSTDITSALVFNQYIAANNSTATYYIVVWLSENGLNQTAGKAEDALKPDVLNPNATEFFSGNVTFISAAGSEVSASFASHVRTGQ